MNAPRLLESHLAEEPCAKWPGPGQNLRDLAKSKARPDPPHVESSLSLAPEEGCVLGIQVVVTTRIQHDQKKGLVHLRVSLVPGHGLVPDSGLFHAIGNAIGIAIGNAIGIAIDNAIDIAIRGSRPEVERPLSTCPVQVP